MKLRAPLVATLLLAAGFCGAAALAGDVRYMAKLDPVTGELSSAKRYTPNEQAARSDLVPLSAPFNPPAGRRVGYDAATQLPVLLPLTRRERLQRAGGSRIIEALLELRALRGVAAINTATAPKLTAIWDYVENGR